MPFEKIFNFGKPSEEPETEEDQDDKDTEDDLVKVRFPQADSLRNLFNVNILKSTLLSRKIPEIRFNKIKPILEGKTKTRVKKLPMFIIPKAKSEKK